MTTLALLSPEAAVARIFGNLGGETPAVLVIHPKFGSDAFPVSANGPEDSIGVVAANGASFRVECYEKNFDPDDEKRNHWRSGTGGSPLEALNALAAWTSPGAMLGEGWSNERNLQPFSLRVRGCLSIPLPLDWALEISEHAGIGVVTPFGRLTMGLEEPFSDQADVMSYLKGAQDDMSPETRMCLELNRTIRAVMRICDLKKTLDRFKGELSALI